MAGSEGGAGREARDAFLRVYIEDLEADRSRSLAEYQRLFPGMEEAVAAEWRLLEVAEEQPVVEPAETLGPYRIVRVLGRGAQATVFLAEHSELRRQVALKVLVAGPPVEESSQGTSSALRRFRREAELSAGLEHPGLCSVYETGQSEGRVWIAMQYIAGETLAERLAQRQAVAVGGSDRGAARRELEGDLEYLEAAARALHAAHETGLVHRDVKPGNLMVAEPDGRAVVLDFGLVHDVEDLGLTRSTEVVGTPYYLAPEQILRTGRAVDRRVDVWALGVTLYECLAGQRPFRAATRDVLYRQIVAEEPAALRRVCSAASRDLEVVVATALSKEVDRRYATALEFAEDLRRVRTGEPIKARPLTALVRAWRWARRHPAVAVSVAVAFLAIGFGLVVSLTALGEARVAIAREQVARLAGYDLLSESVARTEILGRTSLDRHALQRQAMRALEDEVPGLGARLDELADGWTTWRDKKLQERRRGELLAARVGELGPLGRLAAADLLFGWAQFTLFHGERPFEDWDRVGLRLGRTVLALVEHLGPEDPRLIRVRVMLSDGMLHAGQAGAVEEAVVEWRTRDAASGLPVDGRRIALYDSRLEIARHVLDPGPERLDAAERALDRVVADYPGTWISHVGYELLITRCDAVGATERAARLRRALGESTRKSRASLGAPMSQSRHSLFAMVEPERRELVDWIFDSHERSWTPFEEEDVERLLQESAALRSRLGIAPGEHLNELMADSLAAIANNQANLLGGGHPLVERLLLEVVELRGLGPHGARGEPLLAAHYAARGTAEDLARAEDVYRQLLADAPSESARGYLEGDLGVCLLRTGDPARLDEAEALLLRSYEARRALRGANEPVTVQMVRNLISLYEKQGRASDAAAWRRRLTTRR